MSRPIPHLATAMRTAMLASTLALALPLAPARAQSYVGWSTDEAENLLNAAAPRIAALGSDCWADPDACRAIERMLSTADDHIMNVFTAAVADYGTQGQYCLQQPAGHVLAAAERLKSLGAALRARGGRFDWSHAADTIAGWSDLPRCAARPTPRGGERAGSAPTPPGAKPKPPGAQPGKPAPATAGVAPAPTTPTMPVPTPMPPTPMPPATLAPAAPTPGVPVPLPGAMPPAAPATGDATPAIKTPGEPPAPTAPGAPTAPTAPTLRSAPLPNEPAMPSPMAPTAPTPIAPAPPVFIAPTAPSAPSAPSAMGPGAPAGPATALAPAAVPMPLAHGPERCLDAAIPADGALTGYDSRYGGGGTSLPMKGDIACVPGGYWELSPRAIVKFDCDAGFGRCSEVETVPIESVEPRDGKTVYRVDATTWWVRSGL